MVAAASPRWRPVLAGALLLAVAALGWPVRGDDGGEDAFVLSFACSSDKETWIKEAIAAFNAVGRTTDRGRRIRVETEILGSGALIEELLEGHSKAHLVSPSSTHFVRLGNDRSRKEKGRALIGPTRSLARSPAVIALWRRMAEQLGWGKAPLGWSEVLDLARDPRGWAALGKPEWGRFKFGHTDPEFSNAGLLTLFAHAHAATGKTAALTAADVARPEVARSLGQLEQAVVHYGSASGPFAQRMLQHPLGYMHAAVLSENLVVESYMRERRGDPLVAVYPKEGTFWSDHPIGIVERDHVTAEHRAAAETFVAFLLQEPQQKRALAHGLRPAVASVPLGPPLDRAHGVDPRQPKYTLPTPPPAAVDALLGLWPDQKKAAQVVLVFDTSGSMNHPPRMSDAKKGAAELLERLGDRDYLSVLTFGDACTWVCQDVGTDRAGKARLLERINDFIGDGETALYDAVAEAHHYLQAKRRPDRIAAIVVLTDGDDNRSKRTRQELLDKIRIGGETPDVRATRIFTIAYGSDVKNKEALKQIAEATHAVFFESSDDLCEVFRDIATYF